MVKETLTDPATGTVLIGVFIGSSSIFHHYLHPSRLRLELLNTAKGKLNAELYFFSWDDIDYQKLMIGGIYFDDGEKTWAKKMFPFPHIIYLRGGTPPVRSAESARLQRTIKALKIQTVNSIESFDKWDVHQVLCGKPNLLPHLPETRLFNKSAKDLQIMLKKYGRVFLKARRGRQGRQVMQVTASPGGLYEYSFFVEKLTTRKARSIGSLLKEVNEFFHGQGFIIQEPIDLINLDGRKVDLRAEVQRNGNGELEIAAVPVRVGKMNSPITAHSTSYCFDDFFTGIMGYERSRLDELNRRVSILLLEIYHSIEKYYGPFGEMGIDIGLDKRNKLWFIECNSQPAKVSVISAYDRETVLKIFSNPLEYSFLLAGARPPPGRPV